MGVTPQLQPKVEIMRFLKKQTILFRAFQEDYSNHLMHLKVFNEFQTIMETIHAGKHTELRLAFSPAATAFRKSASLTAQRVFLPTRNKSPGINSTICRALCPCVYRISMATKNVLDQRFQMDSSRTVGDVRCATIE